MFANTSVDYQKGASLHIYTQSKIELGNTYVVETIICAYLFVVNAGNQRQRTNS